MKRPYVVLLVMFLFIIVNGSGASAQNISVETVGTDHITETSAIIYGNLTEHPDPESIINITGDVNPDVTGIYLYGGIYENRPYWIHETDEWLIHVDPEEELQWLITDDIDKKSHQAQFTKLADEPPVSYWEEQMGSGTPKSEVIEGEAVYTKFRIRKEGNILWEELEPTEQYERGVFFEIVENLQPETTYEYSALASYQEEHSTGEVMTFTTLEEEPDPEMIVKETHLVLVLLIVITLVLTAIGLTAERHILYLGGLFWIVSGSYLISEQNNMDHPLLFMLFVLIGTLMIVITILETTETGE